VDIQELTSNLDMSGRRITYALAKDGRVFAWGTNLEGTLANGTPGEDDEGNPLFSRFAVPVIVDAINPIIYQ
jgi:alpha-tubulin suppressor-like RCC1 family protein